jgi:Diacylglycerol acyltransferase
MNEPDSIYAKHPPLSSYANKGYRQYSPLYSLGATMLMYAVYISSSMLPALLLLLVVGLAMGSISIHVLAAIITAVALDFAVPLQNGYRPNIDQKKRMGRIFAEGMQLYYPAKSIFLPNNLSKDRAYILAAWPHGLMSGGTHVGFHDFEVRGYFPIFAGASIMRYVPFVRRLLHCMGYCDVTKEGLSKALDVHKNGPTYPFNVVHLVVGGIQEMFYTPWNAPAEQIILYKRKGFIKLALQCKCDVIPMYNFGANQTYNKVFGHKSALCKLSSALQMSCVVWLGRWGIPMGWVPCKVPLMAVIGEVFEVPKVPVDEVSDELVQKVHGDFCKALKKLFDAYKVVYVEEMGADPQWLTRELKLENE